MPASRGGPRRIAALLGGFLLLNACVPRSFGALLTASRSPASVTLAPIPSATPRGSVESTGRGLAIAPLRDGTIGRYQRLELELRTDIVPTNPFDPDELDIRVAFTSPSGVVSDIGAFWYRDYVPPVAVQARGEASWRARFTPTEVGDWIAVARIPDRGLESEPLSFRVEPSQRRGFVRVHPEDARYLAFDDASFFFPIGLNMAWWSGAGTAQSDYERWMTPFAANGGNAIQVWMADWSFGLEWTNTGLGDYTNRLGKAWLLDRIFEMAEERDIYIILVLLNCADFNNWQTNGWSNNPYNADRGGPLEQPEDFVTDPEARRLLQRKLNYIVNRWGYSPNLLAWEWWNEVNLAGISDETLIPWIQEMTAYLRSRDVNRHLVTNSYAISYVSPTWSLPELDIIQRHEYADQERTNDRDLAARAARDIQAIRDLAPVKPVLLGEFGYGVEDRQAHIERTGIHLHNGLWATTFVGYAGSGMYWWWDVYIEPNNLWHHFRSLDRFLEGLDLTEYRPSAPPVISGSDGAAAPADGLRMTGPDLLVWIRSDGYTGQASIDARTMAGSPYTFLYTPPLLEGLVLTLEDVEDGAYLVRWYDPQKGEWLEEVSATASGSRLSIPVPALRRDLAARIVPD